MIDLARMFFYLDAVTHIDVLCQKLVARLVFLQNVGVNAAAGEGRAEEETEETVEGQLAGVSNSALLKRRDIDAAGYRLPSTECADGLSCGQDGRIGESASRSREVAGDSGAHGRQCREASSPGREESRRHVE